MKYLHVSDLHLGLKTDGRDRLDEQRAIMAELVTICQTQAVDVVLLAGDIFQNSVPSAEAEDLFVTTIERLAGKQERVVCVIAGNHDDPERLRAILPLAMKHNIFICTNLEETFQVSPQTGRVQVTDAGKGYITIKKDDDVAVIGFLPYVSDTRMHTLPVQGLPYDEKVVAYAQMVGAHFKKDAFSCLLAHLYARNARTVGENANEQDNRIGELLSVDVQDLPHADYIALGHIHTYQCVHKRSHAYYSGSCIEMQYNDSKKGVVLFEGTAKTGVKNVQFLPLQSVYPLKTLVVRSYEEAVQVLQNEPAQTLIELTFVQDKPLSSSMIKELKNTFPQIVTIRLELLRLQKENSEEISYRKQMTSEELFQAFYTKIRGVEPKPELVEMFATLMEGTDEAN